MPTPTSGRRELRARGLSPELVEFAEASLGSLTGVADLSWQHGESDVWALTSARQRAVLKVHSQGRKWEGELAAYREWLPRLTAAGVAVPRLLAARGEHPRALLISWAQGRLLEELTLPAEVEGLVHERAGRFLRALHELPVEDTDPLPLTRAYRMRVAAWARRARGTVADRTVDAVVDAAGAAEPFMEPLTRVACHRDFTPRNWLVDATGGGREGSAARPPGGGAGNSPEPTVTVIDFEHARPDLYLVDLQRLWVGLWRQRPDLRSSFLHGYGRPLGAGEEEALRGLSALWALSTVVWAREHSDVEFEKLGWDALRWLGLA